MTRYALTTSLATVVVLVASCGTPVIKDEGSQAAQLGSNAPLPPIAVTTRIDFHRVPVPPICPPGGCWKPTAKTLVEFHPSEDLTQARQLAVPKSLNKPHAAAATKTASPRPTSAALSEKQINVYFGYADASLSQEARSTLNDALHGLDTLRNIAIKGRTDGLGASPANQRLALARANAVRQHLLSREAKLATLIEIQARGSCCYVAPNTTPAGRALNRRAEITLVRQDPDA